MGDHEPDRDALFVHPGWIKAGPRVRTGFPAGAIPGDAIDQQLDPPGYTEQGFPVISLFIIGVVGTGEPGDGPTPDLPVADVHGFGSFGKSPSAASRDDPDGSADATVQRPDGHPADQDEDTGSGGT